MPTLEISYRDLCDLIGKNIEMDKLKEEDILLAKCEIDEVVGDTLKVDAKDTNRPDLWSTEGIAREIRYRYKGGFPVYKTRKSRVIVYVDKSVCAVRPFTACAVVRVLKIDKNVLSQMIQLQEKIAGTFGANRREVAIGVYDLEKIKPPIRYTTTGRTELKFVPLDFEKELTPEEILNVHQKGKEFGHLLKGADRYPIFIDSSNVVLSMPPIINSAYTGKVTEKTKDVFIECSGFNMKFLTAALNVIVTALHERGGSIETVEVVYGEKKFVTPDMSPKKIALELKYVNDIAGLGINEKEAAKILSRSGYKVSGCKKLSLSYPAYRQDVMHARDVVEDIIITYGLNRIEPNDKKLPTSGKLADMETFKENIYSILTGAGMQEILSYTLTNKKDIFNNMNASPCTIAEIDNPVSFNWSVFRNWMLPGVMDFLSRNKHIEYPQKVFELGTCIIIDDGRETKSKDEIKLAAAITNSVVNYEDVSSVLDSLMRNIGVSYKLRKYEHGSFVGGRCAEIVVGGKHAGIIGEINPSVLNNWKLDKPVVAFELDLTYIFAIKNEYGSSTSGS